MMKNQSIVSRSEWLVLRKQLLAEEKRFTHLREELSEKRRQLPWTKVEPRYVFDGPSGKESLADLFEGRSQLVVYHFMFAPEAEAPCKSCSFWADSFNGVTAHLQQRDVTFVAISRGPLTKLQAFAKRMDWSFKWVSSQGNDFNYDYAVSFKPEELAKGTMDYNFGTFVPRGPDMPGISVFAKEGDSVFHTYSCFGRGIDMMNTAYQYLDLVPKGRNEEGLAHTMAWVNYHDRYTR